MNTKRSDSLKTRETLLSKVRSGDEKGWSEFYDLYEDFIYSAARGSGLTPDESKDVVQDVMLSVQKYIADFVVDASRGRFRTWLRRIVQSRIADQFRQKKRNPLEHVALPAGGENEGSRTSPIDRIPNSSEIDLDRLIDEKFELAILAEARRAVKRQVRVEDYQAYNLFEVRELTAAKAAEDLGISPVTVRVRTFRVRRAVAREIRRIVRLLEKGTLR